MYSSFSKSDDEDKHKVFISFYHKDDEKYRDEFEELFGHLFINKSVNDGDIDEDNSDDYIKRLIQDDYISDASVVLVLCGPNTWKRKHVDWEISAGLSKKVGGYSGLVAVHLPTHPDYQEEKYKSDNLPPRLVDNLKTGFATIQDWTTDESKVKNMIQKAFDRRTEDDDIDNSREQYTDNID